MEVDYYAQVSERIVLGALVLTVLIVAVLLYAVPRWRQRGRGALGSRSRRNQPEARRSLTRESPAATIRDRAPGGLN